MPVTVSFEMAKNLKEAGFRQKSTWFFQDCTSINAGIILRLEQSCPSDKDDKFTAAPQTDEILAEFPQHFANDECLEIHRGWGMWHVNFKGGSQWEDELLPGALATMWLYLKEQGLLKESNDAGKNS